MSIIVHVTWWIYPKDSQRCWFSTIYEVWDLSTGSSNTGVWLHVVVTGAHILLAFTAILDQINFPLSITCACEMNFFFSSLFSRFEWSWSQDRREWFVIRSKHALSWWRSRALFPPAFPLPSWAFFCWIRILTTQLSSTFICTDGFIYFQVITRPFRSQRNENLDGWFRCRR